MRVRTRLVVPPGVGGAVMLVGASGRTEVKRRGHVSRARSSARIRPEGVTRRLRSSTVSVAAVSACALPGRGLSPARLPQPGAPATLVDARGSRIVRAVEVGARVALQPVGRGLRIAGGVGG